MSMISNTYVWYCFLCCIVYCLFSQPSYAGGEISAEELAFHTKRCDGGYSGDSCLRLAEETLCGRGFNEETAVLVGKAAVNYQSNCAKGHARSCYDYSLFVLSCLPTTTEFTEYILVDYVPQLGASSLSCQISWSKESITEEEKQSQQIALSIDLLTKACSHNVVDACLLLGELYSTAEVKKLKKAKQVWEKACELSSKKGCELLQNGSMILE